MPTKTEFQMYIHYFKGCITDRPFPEHERFLTELTEIEERVERFDPQSSINAKILESYHPRRSFLHIDTVENILQDLNSLTERANEMIGGRY